MSALHLKYWNGRGLMEVPRMCCAATGKVFTDGRYNAPEGDLSCNLGRMPVAQVGDSYIGQSTAINFFVASDCGLMGSSTIEAAQILAIQEHLSEMTRAWRAVCSYGTEPTAEVLDKWFASGATDVTGPADRAGYATRFGQWWVGRIEAALTGTGFAVGSKLSLADILLYNTFAEELKDTETPADTPQWKKEAFGSKARVATLLASSPKITASIAAVSANAGIQSWLAGRGPQGF